MMLKEAVSCELRGTRFFAVYARTASRRCLQGNAIKAEAVLRTLLHLHPNSIPALDELGTSYRSQSTVDSAPRPELSASRANMALV